MNHKFYLSATILFCVCISGCQLESEKAWHERKCQEITKKIGLNYQPVTIYEKPACESKDKVNAGDVVLTNNIIFLDQRK
ncbi:hypothetical protein SR1949_48340 [Sphaerospermopsis reniformis]|uniref:Uncharacterized protein n=1 Tax=Sphaerospermopsis reniformis TaxID=531300 RepID=A0A480A732_9CYAN|nr:hypothetical protein [Sphaerospermopsis reniformis]GCL39706.1 hypothetical protein SR1949_48340 [Sphaerospermopsis reniformis]